MMEEIKEINIEDGEIKITKKELTEITNQLQELKELSLIIGKELYNQNKKIDKIELLIDDNKNILHDNNIKLDDIKKEINTSNKFKYNNLFIIGGILLLPISLKIAIPITLGGMAIKYISH